MKEEWFQLAMAIMKRSVFKPQPLTYLHEQIQAMFPTHEIYSKEHKEGWKGHLWMIHQQHSILALAYFHKEKPIFSILYDMQTQQCYHTQVNKGVTYLDCVYTHIIEGENTEEVRIAKASTYCFQACIDIITGNLNLYACCKASLEEYGPCILFLQELHASYSIYNSFFSQQPTKVLFARKRSYIQTLQETKVFENSFSLD